MKNILRWCNLFKGVERIEATQTQIINLLTEMETKRMADSTANKAALDAIKADLDAALTGIASDIAALTERVSTGMSQADVDSFKADLADIATRAAGIDALNPAA